MILGQFVTTCNEANVYILGCEKTREAAMIDAGAFEPEMERFLGCHGLHLTTVFITHDHYDHIDGLEKITGKLVRNTPRIFAFRKRPGWQFVKEGDGITLGALNGQVLATAGHTEDSVTYVWEDRIAFVGDCLFAGSIGGTSSDAKKQEEIRAIKTKLFPLGDHVELYPGHGAPTTVGIERNKNPFLS